MHPDRINWYDGAFHWGVRAQQVQPGNKAKMRIISSDGFQSTTVTSASFKMPDLGPGVGIDQPANNARVDSFLLTLRGFAYDAVDGDRRGSIEWTSSEDGMLGRGAEVSVASLSTGVHDITLTATDKDGHSTSAVVRVTVRSGSPPSGDEHVYLPTMQR